MKNYFKDRENRIMTAVFAITVLIAAAPLISRYCINGHDLEYHLLRIEALKDDILLGHPFAKVNSLFFGGAGYASSMFYSDLLLFIPALLRVAGLSIAASYHIFAFLCIVFTYVSTFICTKGMTESRYAGCIAAMFLTLAPYHMDDIMVRGAVGEYTAFIFIPVVIYGIYNVLYEDMDKPWIFALGFIGVLLCHFATLIMCLIFCVVAFIIKIREFISKPIILLRLLITTFVSLILSAFYWVPLVEQMYYTSFKVSDNWSDLLDSALDVSHVFSQVFPCMGFMLVLFAVLRVFVSKKDVAILEYADWMLIGGGVFCFLTTNIMPWEYVGRFFGFLQFPWRFFIIATALLAIADGIIAYAFIEKIIASGIGGSIDDVAKSVMVTAVLIILGGASLIHQSVNDQGYFDYSDDYYSYKPFTATVIAGEWLPEAVSDVEGLVDMSEQLIADSGEAIDFNRVGLTLAARIDKPHEYVDVPFVYYRGYVAEYADADNKRVSLPISGNGRNGMIRVDLKDKGTGILYVRYAGTVLQNISLIASMAAFALIILIWQLLLRKKKREEKQ